jgi:hypothetical protein
MKVLIVFRGGYARIDPTLLVKNICDKVYTPLIKNKIEYTTVLYTYPTDTERLTILKEGLGVRDIHFTKEGQIENFTEAVHGISMLYSDYDYIIFLRFEIIYKIDIMNWNIFNRSGLFFPFKENCITLFTATRQYSDIIIAISKEYVKPLSLVIDTVDRNQYTNTNTLHNLGFIVERKDYYIPVVCMLDGFYQSNTSLALGDDRLNPMFIMSHYKYNGSDRKEFSEYLPSDQDTYPVSYQPRYTPSVQFNHI